MRVNHRGFVEKKTSPRKGDSAPTYRDWWIVKQRTGNFGGVVNLGSLFLPARYVGKKIRIKILAEGEPKIDSEIRKIDWEKLDENTWENKNPGNYDFVITKEKGTYVLDIFDAKIKKSKKAYIKTKGCKTLREAKKEAEDQEGEI